MAHPAVAVLESALRARKLDRTLTTTLPSWEWADPSCLLADGYPARGCLSAWRAAARPTVGVDGSVLVRADDASAAAHGGRHATG